MRVSPSNLRGEPFLWTLGVAACETLRYLEENQIDAKPLLAEAELSRGQLLQHRSGISVASQYRFLDLAAVVTNDSLFGLHLAAEMDLRRAGLLFYLAASSLTVLEALENFARYGATTSEAVQVELSRHKDTTTVTLHPVGHDEFRRQWSEFIALAVIRMLRLLTGRDFAPARMTFAHARNSDLQEVRRLLRCPVEFADVRMSWVLPHSVMELPIKSEDSRLLEILTAHGDDLLTKRRAAVGLLSMVENQLISMLPSGEVQAAAVARQLGMSLRSLTRRLGEEGTAFGEILDRVRNRLALRYLEDDDLSLQQIALLLGYSEIGAFNHAFKRWTGTSPGRARREPSVLASAL